MIVLDTHVISELRKKPHKHGLALVPRLAQRLGLHALALRPIDGEVLAQVFGQFAGDLLQRLVAQFTHGRLVVGQRVVEPDLVLGQPQLLAAGGQRDDAAVGVGRRRLHAIEEEADPAFPVAIGSVD